MKKLVFTIVLAAVLWSIMFLPVTAPHVNFWWMMTASACTLSILSSIFNPGWWKDMIAAGALQIVHSPAKLLERLL